MKLSNNEVSSLLKELETYLESIEKLDHQYRQGVLALAVYNERKGTLLDLEHRLVLSLVSGLKSAA